MDENCYVGPIQKNATAEETYMVEMALLTVWGMGCPICAARVRNSLLSQNGVVEAYVDHITSIARVAFNPELASVETLFTRRFAYARTSGMALLIRAAWAYHRIVVSFSIINGLRKE